MYHQYLNIAQNVSNTGKVSNNVLVSTKGYLEGTGVTKKLVFCFSKYFNFIHTYVCFSENQVNVYIFVYDSNLYCPLFVQLYVHKIKMHRPMYCEYKHAYSMAPS